MKFSLLTFILILSGFAGWGQKSNSPHTKKFLIDTTRLILDLPDMDLSEHMVSFNDTAYLRILNGILIGKDYSIMDFGNASSIYYITDKQKIAQLGIKTDKPLMIIGIKTFDIEYQIDSVLYSRPDFISRYKYSSAIQLPVSVNGKLLSNDERQTILPKLELNKIKEINYSNNNTSGLTPFGIIELQLNSH
jgi:hypothetical protein